MTCNDWHYCFSTPRGGFLKVEMAYLHGVTTSLESHKHKRAFIAYRGVYMGSGHVAIVPGQLPINMQSMTYLIQSYSFLFLCETIPI